MSEKIVKVVRTSDFLSESPPVPGAGYEKVDGKWEGWFVTEEEAERIMGEYGESATYDCGAELLVIDDG